MVEAHDLEQSLGGILLQASFDGRLKSNEGFLSATGDLCTLTAGSGKDLYLTGAKVVFFGNTLGNSSASKSAIGDEITLDVNGTIKETVKNTAVYNIDGSANIQVYEFKNLFHKVEASQILKLEVITLDADTDVEGFIQAIEVPSGENPTTYKGE